MARHLTLTLLPGLYAVCRLSPKAKVPRWSASSVFSAVTRTAEELSVVAEQRRVPRGVRAERGFRLFKLEGPFDFSLVGVLASVLQPLARAKISIFAVSTYDTDYVLVRKADVRRAIACLRAAGHKVKEKR